MSADSNNGKFDSNADLASLQLRLHDQSDDETMLVEVGIAMRSMLSGKAESEDRIRTMLQNQFDEGHLRKETYELVQNLLGKIVTEELVRAPLPPSASLGDELFAKTAVIEEQAQAQIEAKKPPSPTQSLESTAEPEQDIHVGSILRDRFLLKTKVSEGSMGVVYKALDKRMAEADDDSVYVAIKVLSPQLSRNAAALRALQQEAAKGRCLSHPNIVRFVDLDREGDQYFIIMEWLEGRSLSRILDDDRGSVLDIQTAMDIVRQTASALDYAHQRGVIHADVKPGNIIITPSGEVKLIDFGVARVRQKENQGKSRFDPEVVRAGTPAYSSMQVLTGEDPVPADDVFSLACLLYRLIAGFRVYGPRNAAQAAEDGMEPQRPQGLPDAQWQPLKKALSYSRVTRFESASAFVKALGIKPAGKAPQTIPVASKPVSPVSVEKAHRVEDAAKSPPPVPSEPDDLPVARQKLPDMVPIRAEKESRIFDNDDDDDDTRRSPWRLAVVGIILVASTAVVVTRTDIVDRIGSSVESIDVSPVTDVFRKGEEIIDLPSVDEAAHEIAEFDSEVIPAGETTEVTDEVGDIAASDGAVEAAIDEADNLADGGALLSGVPVDEPVDEPELYVPDVDYSTLPPATLTLTIAAENGSSPVESLTIREGNDAAIIDIFREDFALPQSMEISEIQFTGNQSPLRSGQYSLENNGRIEFAAGQERARLTISMRSNPVREPDREVELTIRDSGDLQRTLGKIEMTLEDDDQRAFEQGLPRNTVAFAVNQISVREFDPAAQVDVIRYNADNAALEVPYVLRDVTATEGQDYFTPGSTIIYFAAGQRTARILVPLGQDARSEPDEAFILELEAPFASSDSNIFSQIAVMIRDDDS